MTLSVLISVLVASGPVSAGVIIDDRSYFDFPQRTLIDFESRADGSDPFDGLSGEVRMMPRDEYAGLGMRFSDTTAPRWIEVFRDGAQDVLASGGSPTIFVGFGSNEPTQLEFLTPVRAFGFFASSERLGFIPPLEPSGLRIFDTGGALLEEFLLVGDLVDGQIGDVEFGFIGYEAPRGTFIGRVEVIRPTVFGIDDLMFSSVPAPGAALVMTAAAVFTSRRQRAR